MLFTARIFTVHFSVLQCRKAARQQKCTRRFHLYRKHFCYTVLSQTQDKKSHLQLLSAVLMIAALFYKFMRRITCIQRRNNSQWVAYLIYFHPLCLQITPGVFSFPEFIHYLRYLLSDFWGLFSSRKTSNFRTVCCFVELRTGVCFVWASLLKWEFLELHFWYI